jgi:hypothetical protein
MSDAFYDYVVSSRRIPEVVVPGKRLGRHVRHDSRSLDYRYEGSGAPLKTGLILRHIPILNQGDAGDCTENAEVGALGTGPLWAALQGTGANNWATALNENLAISMYSDEEVLLGYGPYPPNDNGGDGLAACQVAQKRGFISGYTHCLALNDILQAISDGKPVMIGSNWYDSFDTPVGHRAIVDIAPGATVRGGHEYLARGINVEEQLVFLDNSWGNSWGDNGSFLYSWDTLARLLSEQGDGTVPTPLAVAA